MGKLLALLDLFRKGSAVSDPALWKNRSALVMALGALIVAAAQVAKGYGYDLGIDNDTASAIAGGVAALVGVFSTFATSNKVGLGSPRDGTASGQPQDFPVVGSQPANPVTTDPLRAGAQAPVPRDYG